MQNSQNSFFDSHVSHLLHKFEEIPKIDYEFSFTFCWTFKHPLIIPINHILDGNMSTKSGKLKASNKYIGDIEIERLPKFL